MPRATPTLSAALPSGHMRPGQQGWQSFMGDARKEADALYGKLKAGDITAREWGEQFHSFLISHHAESWRLGRNQSGDFALDDETDLFIGISKADGDSQYLLKFIGDIEAGRYQDEDGVWKDGAFGQRQNLYVSKGRGTANEAFAESSDDDEAFDWVLGGTEDHCDDCPALAAASPWARDDLFTHPGAGDTPCLSHCKCHLVRKSDGISGFKP